MGIAEWSLGARTQWLSSWRWTNSFEFHWKKQTTANNSSFTYGAWNKVFSFHHRIQLHNINSSEYSSRYFPHEPKSYIETKRFAIPRLYSTALDRTNAVNKDLNYRSISNSSRRQPTTRDAKEIDYLTSFQRNVDIPRTYYYLGKATDTVDEKTREKFPFLPSPINTLQQIQSSTIEQLPHSQQSIFI